MNKTLLITNRICLFTWIFSLIWCSMSLTGIYITVKDWNILDTTSKYLILFICITGIIILISYSLSKNMIKAQFNRKNNNIVITKIFLHSKQVQSFPISDLKDLLIIKTEDSEGGDYYKLIINFKNSEDFCLKEGHNKDVLETIRNDIINYIN